MALVIILGDPHLGRSLSLGKVSLGSTLNSRVIDQISLLDWTLEQAIENDASHIIVSGDVFEDPKPHPTLITSFFSWLKKCEINDIKVDIVVGNHDTLRTGSFYTSALDIISECALENVSIYNDINTTFIDDVAFTYIPFRDRKSYNVETNAEALTLLQGSLIYELASVPSAYTKVIVGHLALEGSIPVGDEIDDLVNELFCPLDMFQGYDYVWMGHIHKPQVMKKNPFIAHIGSMDISNFGETDHKKHIVLLDTNNVAAFKQISLPTRPLKKIIISVPKDIKDTTLFVKQEIEKEKENLARAIVRLEVHLTSPELLPINRSSIEKFLYDQKVFNVSSISESKKLSPIKKDGAAVIDTTMDVPAAIKTFATQQIEEDLQGIFLELATDIYSQYKSEIKD